MSNYELKTKSRPNKHDLFINIAEYGHKQIICDIKEMVAKYKHDIPIRQLQFLVFLNQPLPIFCSLSEGIIYDEYAFLDRMIVKMEKDFDIDEISNLPISVKLDTFACLYEYTQSTFLEDCECKTKELLEDMLRVESGEVSEDGPFKEHQRYVVNKKMDDQLHIGSSIHLGTRIDNLTDAIHYSFLKYRANKIGLIKCDYCHEYIYNPLPQQMVNAAKDSSRGCYHKKCYIQLGNQRSLEYNRKLKMKKSKKKKKTITT